MIKMDTKLPVNFSDDEACQYNVLHFIYFILKKYSPLEKYSFWKEQELCSSLHITLYIDNSQNELNGATGRLQHGSSHPRNVHLGIGPGTEPTLMTSIV